VRGGGIDGWQVGVHMGEMEMKIDSLLGAGFVLILT
jgi:hypothetical protein